VRWEDFSLPHTKYNSWKTHQEIPHENDLIHPPRLTPWNKVFKKFLESIIRYKMVPSTVWSL
jgi:hypothetical protein